MGGDRFAQDVRNGDLVEFSLSSSSLNYLESGINLNKIFEV